MSEANITIVPEERRYVSLATWDENLSAFDMLQTVRRVMNEHPEADTVLLTRAEVERLLEYICELEALA